MTAEKIIHVDKKSFEYFRKHCYNKFRYRHEGINFHRITDRMVFEDIVKRYLWLDDNEYKNGKHPDI